MSTSQNDIIATLNADAVLLYRYVTPVTIALGTFGNLFNIIIFTRRTLRTNPCAMYFLADSINNFYCLYTGVLARCLSGWGIDPSLWNNAVCKLRNFFSNPPLVLMLWFVVLASIDRFLCSSRNARFRQLSSISIARKAIIATVLLTFLSHVHVLIFYSVTSHGCDYARNAYATFYIFWSTCISTTIPVTLMTIFGILTLRNTYKIHHRVGQQNNNPQNERLRSNDRQLRVMLLFQLLICILFSAPFFIANLYLVITTYILSYTFQPYGLAVFNFLYGLSRAIYFFNASVGFYVYTLTGPKFRTEFIHCTRSALKVILTATGLIQYMPLRVQQAMRNVNEIGANNQVLATATGGTSVRRIQQQQPLVLIDAT